MRPLLLISVLALAAASPAVAAAPLQTPASSAPAAAADPDDVASIDAIIAALYEVISGEAGQARDWDRFHSLFLPSATMGGAGRGPDGVGRLRPVPPADYVARNSPYFAEHAFYEREIGRSTQRFGPLIEVLSAYEIREAPDAPAAAQRGVNAIQLFDDGRRLWIASVLWAAETPETPIPPELLTTP